ncbi:amine oxidoreductase [Fulvivirga sp. M361]|uniref:flavin monoamine oxidase family protein n=1 Tax=Fulvivirga sp. M361 TaxID=2594266 RepID=UPI0011799DDE|nr:FAD-dependent oxidoreductase [Fulvivirga sp. M361]TRX60571.1 amine oxidoreductase [Fulvivirga sp. M361]
MQQVFTKYIIVGAGLSGLTSAYRLYQAGETDFIILESRDRIGGRIFTKNRIDFGAVWFQTHHQQVVGLLEELGIAKFHQYSEGENVLVYSTMAPAHYFRNDPNAAPASRISGSSMAMIEALARSFSEKIKLDTNVTAINVKADGLQVIANDTAYQAEKAIVTIPPRIVTRITFSPDLPATVTEVMKNTHTWMSNAIKIGMTFAKPFWRDKNLSGTMLGQVGPVVELYDHSDHLDEHYALMGFVNETLRDTSAEKRKQRIMDYLSKYLGNEVLNYLTYEEKDWSKDMHTSCETIKSIYMSPQYGHPLFEASYLDGRLFFSGAETAPAYGGYMDGAVLSGNLNAGKLMTPLTPRHPLKGG